MTVKAVPANARELMDEPVQVKHPDSGSWLNATIVMTKGSKVTVKFVRGGEIVTVKASNVRPISPAKQGR